MTDVTTGLFLHGGIMAALLGLKGTHSMLDFVRSAAREKTGRGQKVDTSLLEAQVAALVNIGVYGCSCV